ncbi:hypothetical protein QEH42_gp158 [Microbacterium phage Pumpernickel]|uniref:Uncharacterized protein n=1 Tax=Microbacterium phage Pumpernickel TaxID=2885983 RepID=A0AAE8Y7Q9_9CAUD|nr:hypothetical protein QEH42_gp009 [Microbacterium phage Pumpernickel]YP_010755300.1 hypothetical protein QEH42_gp158 [Microbacterium phage Pumpernickel]UDL15800.1 hypothetical protein SEA_PUMPERNICKEL_9 [Microbacterium phage Pumpernickel]UDL16060.1 hypothetical protein SEA_PUMPERNICKEL_310 [Microbacterium phage Pumpernickel]
MTEQTEPTTPEFVKSYTPQTVEDLQAMKADEEFSDGAIAWFTFPTSPPQIFISYTNPKFFLGQVAYLGDTISKDAAGNFYVNGVTR